LECRNKKKQKPGQQQQQRAPTKIDQDAHAISSPAQVEATLRELLLMES
jgi:hypothetical protein